MFRKESSLCTILRKTALGVSAMKIGKSIQLIALLGLFSVFALTGGCGNTIEGGVPNVAVNITIYPSQPEYFDLQAPGGWVYITGGYRGIIVYRHSESEFRSYDRACPIHFDEPCGRVDVDETNNVLATCPCDSLVWSIIDGGPVSASLPLQGYSTFYDGNRVDIIN